MLLLSPNFRQIGRLERDRAPEGSPSQTPNEFGAQEKSVINPWLKPVEWAILKGTKYGTKEWEQFTRRAEVSACREKVFGKI